MCVWEGWSWSCVNAPLYLDVLTKCMSLKLIGGLGRVILIGQPKYTANPSFVRWVPKGFSRYEPADAKTGFGELRRNEFPEPNLLHFRSEACEGMSRQDARGPYSPAHRCRVALFASEAPPSRKFAPLVPYQNLLGCCSYFPCDNTDTNTKTR